MNIQTPNSYFTCLGYQESETASSSPKGKLSKHEKQQRHLHNPVKENYLSECLGQLNHIKFWVHWTPLQKHSVLENTGQVYF